MSTKSFCDGCHKEFFSTESLYSSPSLFGEYCSYCLQSRVEGKKIVHVFFRGIVFYGATCECGWSCSKDIDLRDSCKREAIKHSFECGSIFIDPPPFSLMRDRKRISW